MVLRQCTVVLWRAVRWLPFAHVVEFIYTMYRTIYLFIYLLTYLYTPCLEHFIRLFIYLFIYSCISRVQYMAESTKEEMDTFGMHVAIDAGFSVPSRDLSVCGLHCEGS